MPENKNALTEAVFYILLCLVKPNHGYGIIKKTEAMTSDRLTLGAGTLYGALNTLAGKGWIMAHSGAVSDRKKEYVITEFGKAVLKQELKRLNELVQNGNAVMDEG